MPSGFRPERGSQRVPGSQEERAPAPAFWAGEKRRVREPSVSAERAQAEAAADWPAPGRKLGLYLQLITLHPTQPPPSWRQRPQAESPLPLPLGNDTNGKGAAFTKRLFGAIRAPTCPRLWPPWVNREAACFRNARDIDIGTVVYSK